ncbi:SulP family inorganic anion transporter [Magnetovibrio sp.]|uniref:SulP family inorganic anion transporter n=1 Tax=Magnetovibrio sp. TaxID=2024836 RepID=UPI002F9227BB
MFFPFLAWFPMVTKETLRADIIAGITGAVIVLPQGVAFAMIAGLPPQYGLYTAMVTPIVAALFGSSKHLISGPTTAISIVVFSTISGYATPGTPEFISLALTLTFLAGVYQFAFGLARLGMVVNFVSHTVVVGFTAGAAILIATSQMKNVLGVNAVRGDSFLHTWVNIWDTLGSFNGYVFLVAMTTLVLALAIKRWKPRIPNLLLALIAGSVLSYVLGGESHGVTVVGEIPAQLPPLSSPTFSFATVKMLAPQAFAVALLGLIEAVSISRSIAAKSHQRIDSSQEFVGQGLSNIVGSFLSSYAGSGSFTRSGVNYTAGAQTPLSAIFAAVFLMGIVLLVAPLSAYLPLAAMGGVIMVVALNLIDIKQIKHVLVSSKTESAILLTTFFSTLFLELEFAIYLGVLVSLVIFLARTSFPEIVTLAPDVDPRFGRHILTDVTAKPLAECPRLKIVRVDMSIYFGSLNHIEKKLYDISEKQGVQHILIMGAGINLVDLSGSEMLLHLSQHLEKKGGGLYFCGLKPGVYQSMAKAHLIRDIKNWHFFDEKKDAIRTLRRLFRKQGACENCSLQVFQECKAEAAE